LDYIRTLRTLAATGLSSWNIKSDVLVMTTLSTNVWLSFTQKVNLASTYEKKQLLELVLVYQ